MAKNVYDLGGGKFQIVAVYKGQRRDGKIRATGEREAAKAQRRLQLELEKEIDEKQAAPAADPTFVAFTSKGDPEAGRAPGPYHSHIMNRRRIGEATFKNRAYQLATLAEFFGDYPLSEIGPSLILEYQDHRGSLEIEASTINGEVKILRAIVNVARLRGLVVQDIGKDRVPDLDESETDAEAWSTEQMHNLLESAWRRSPRLYGIVLILANTGMRRGEAINLQWSAIDLETGMITLRPSKWWKPKNKKFRKIPISDALAEYFRTAARRSMYVATNRKGEPYAYWPQLQFDDARRSAVPMSVRERHARTHRGPIWECDDCCKHGLHGGPHRIRHTFASHFLAEQPDMFLLAEILGHSHVQMTKRYSHMLPDHLERARGAVNFGDSSAATTKARGRWGGKSKPVK